MFQPFLHKSEFYAGLVLWCDPNSWEIVKSTCPPNEIYDPKRAHELRPCLVVAVDHDAGTIQVTRLCANTPVDPSKWVRINTAPALTWRLPDAWIWVGTPPTVQMVLNSHKAMHPHKDTYFSTPPVSVVNLESYRVHRQNYLTYGPVFYQSTQIMGSPYTGEFGSTIFPHNNALYVPSATMPASTAPQHPALGAFPGPAPYAPAYPTMSSMTAQQGGFTSLSPQHIVVPAGFTETHPAQPGWFRNPETGWFWTAARGLVPPTAFATADVRGQ